MTESLIEMSEAIDQIAKVLPEAQAAISPITRDAANPHFNSRYTSLSELAEAIVPAMNKHGITVLQPASAVGNLVNVTTMLLHTSTQWLRATHTIPVTRADAQGVGSAITYARRQALQSMFSVAPAGEDDDGEGSVGRGAGRPPIPPTEPKRPDRVKRVERLETTLQTVKILRDLEKAWELGRGLRDECAAEAPELAARLADVYERNHAALLRGAG